jgi:hypothetical protein
MRRLFLVIVGSIILVTACGGEDPGGIPAFTATLEITVVAGPVCPVETDPPSPHCAPRPVNEAVIVVAGFDGAEVASATTGSDGFVVIDVAPGQITVVPQPFEGLLGTTDAVTVTVTDGQTQHVTVAYDTGIS